MYERRYWQRISQHYARGNVWTNTQDWQIPQKPQRGSQKEQNLAKTIASKPNFFVPISKKMNSSTIQIKQITITLGG